MKAIRLLPILVFILLGLALVPGQSAARSKGTGSYPILGIWFSQPPTDNVKIVYVNHQELNVSNETFGTSYTQAATDGCVKLGVPPVYLVRYRQGTLGGWVVWCYTSQTTYVQFSGAQFGQATIDQAVARARCLAYGVC